MIRTCDPLIRSAVTSTASGYGFYDLLTFVTGCSRQRVDSLSPIQASFAVVLSQVCLNWNELCIRIFFAIGTDCLQTAVHAAWAHGAASRPTMCDHVYVETISIFGGDY